MVTELGDQIMAALGLLDRALVKRLQPPAPLVDSDLKCPTFDGTSGIRVFAAQVQGVAELSRWLDCVQLLQLPYCEEHKNWDRPIT